MAHLCYRKKDCILCGLNRVLNSFRQTNAIVFPFTLNRLRFLQQVATSVVSPQCEMAVRISAYN